jgi:hypothetical protein
VPVRSGGCTHDDCFFSCSIIPLQIMTSSGTETANAAQLDLSIDQVEFHFRGTALVDSGVKTQLILTQEARGSPPYEGGEPVEC